MASQLMCVPVILTADCAKQSELVALGEVAKSEEGWIINYTASVNYFGDDETFIYDFWHAVAGMKLQITNDDLIRFDWDQAKRA